MMPNESSGERRGRRSRSGDGVSGGRAEEAPRIPKLQRLTDFIAALLARRYPVTLAELRRDVPAYAHSPSEAAVERMFERDKKELRAFGVPIETTTVEQDGQPISAYRLRERDFYLPFLALAESGTGRRRGGSSIAALVFEPDELAVISRAAARVRALGDPHLLGDVESAVRKLAADLPIDNASATGEYIVAAPVNPRVFAALGGALSDRKRVEFDYHKMGDDSTSRRVAEPYGLVFIGTHWYLVARDLSHGELRHFRLSRMSGISINSRNQESPDFAVPTEFDLAEHSQSREAWQLGDGDAVDVLVAFRGNVGAVRAATRLGEPVEGEPGLRRFRVRRGDAFVRWLLSFAGDAIPVEPREMHLRFRDLARETLAVYAKA